MSGLLAFRAKSVIQLKRFRYGAFLPGAIEIQLSCHCHVIVGSIASRR
jgi:hypothetical protein